MTEQDFYGTGKNESEVYSQCYLTIPVQIREIEAIPENQLNEKSLEELQDKFKEYQQQIGPISDLFEQTKTEYTETYTLYSQIFSKLGVLESIMASLDLSSLGGEYLELEDTSALATFFEVKDIAGTAFGFIGAIYSAHRWHKAYKVAKAAKAEKVAKAALEVSSESGTAVVASAGKFAKIGKVLPVISGIGSLAFGVISAYSVIKGKAELVEALKRNIINLSIWFADTQIDIINMCTGEKEMRTELNSLKAELGVTTDAELLQALDESLKSAGKFEAVTQIVLRILCNDKDKPPVEQTPVATIATITGLPETYISLRKSQVSSNPGICDSL